MLTFFRRIRKVLLDSGQAQKYLLYAIGEIALVVIGILIALQINNWNQDRLNRIEESRIHEAISKDMARIHSYCKVCGGRLQQAIEASQRLLENIQNENDESIENNIQQEVEYLMTRCFIGEGLVSNIYDVLMGSDQLELLSSRELRDELGKLDSWIGTIIPYENLQAEFVDQQLTPFINTHIDRLPMSVDRLGMDPSIDKAHFNSSYSDLLSKRAFSNLLIDLMINTTRITGLHNRIEKSIRDIDGILIQESPSLEAEILLRTN